jgi:hypothetical protein
MTFLFPFRRATHLRPANFEEDEEPGRSRSAPLFDTNVIAETHKTMQPGGRRIFDGDAVIAARARGHGCVLATRNVESFPGFAAGLFNSLFDSSGTRNQC